MPRTMLIKQETDHITCLYRKKTQLRQTDREILNSQVARLFYSSPQYCQRQNKKGNVSFCNGYDPSQLTSVFLFPFALISMGHTFSWPTEIKNKRQWRSVDFTVTIISGLISSYILPFELAAVTAPHLLWLSKNCNLPANFGVHMAMAASQLLQLLLFMNSRIFTLFQK